MEQLNINGHIVHVDVEKTMALYAELPLISDKVHCGCSDCVDYENAIVRSSSSVQAFFKRLGMDPRKEAEVWKVSENDDGSSYFVADYHIIGEIQGVAELEWIDVEEASFGLTNRTDYLPSPMIPESFTPSIIEVIVRIHLRVDR